MQHSAARGSEAAESHKNNRQYTLEREGRAASPRDENFLREGGGRLRFLSSWPDRPGRIENPVAGWGRPNRVGNVTFWSPREIIVAKWFQNVMPVDFLAGGKAKVLDRWQILTFLKWFWSPRAGGQFWPPVKHFWPTPSEMATCLAFRATSAGGRRPAPEPEPGTCT